MCGVSKNLKYFVLCCLVGFGLLAYVSYRVGFELVYLAFFDPKRTEPMLVLQGGGAANQAELERRLEPFDAQQLAHYTHVYSAAGRERDQIAEMVVIEFAAGGDAVRILTDLEQPTAADDLPTHIYSTYQMFDDPLPKVLVFWLAQRSSEEANNPLGALAQHSQLGDKVYWQGHFTTLRGPRWDDALVMGFATTREATAWLGADETRLLRDFIGARSKALQVSVFAAE